MAVSIKTCRMQDIVSDTESGELDQKRILEIVGKVAAAAADHPGHNVLLDMRETQLPDTSLGEIMEATLKAESFDALHNIKIASVMPNESMRVFLATRASGFLQVHGIDHQSFTDVEAAKVWLAD